MGSQGSDRSTRRVRLIAGFVWAALSSTLARAEAPAPNLPLGPAPVAAPTQAPLAQVSLDSASGPTPLVLEPPDFTLDYEAVHRDRVAHPLRAIAEEVLFIGVGTSWYWAARKQNLFDWDKPSLKQRFTVSGYRFDNNYFPINFIWHPLSGAAYYSAARTNGHSLLAASGYAILACLSWEYGIEFREKVSINDLLFTPLPSITIGEFYSRLGMYLNRSPWRFGPGRKAIAYLFATMQTGHDALDGVSRVVPGEADALGYSDLIYHRFDMRAGYGTQSVQGKTAQLSELRLDGELVSIPRFGRSGRLTRLLHDGDFARLSLHTAQGPAGQEIELLNDLTLLGFYRQRISEDLRGGSIFAGTSLGYRYRKLRFDGFSDDLALTRLPGFASDMLLRQGEVLARLRFRVHPEFAGVRSLAYKAYAAAHPDELVKSTLPRAGYLYAFGVSADVDAELTLGAYVSFGGRLSWVYLNSKEGRDRNQEELTADPKGVERALDAEGFVRVYPLGRRRMLLVEIAILTRRRDSTLGGFHAENSLTRGGLRVGADF